MTGIKMTARTVIRGLAVLLLLTPVPSHADRQEPGAGDTAPEFTVVTGSGIQLQSGSLRGRVVVITYETKETTDMNQKFKDAVLRHCRSDRAAQRAIEIVPVINCFKYVWPGSKICASQVRKNARRLGLEIYIDHDGRMFEDYGMSDNESTVVIIDKKGLIRYRKSGRLSSEDVETAMMVLRKSAVEE